MSACVILKCIIMCISQFQFHTLGMLVANEVCSYFSRYMHAIFSIC